MIKNWISVFLWNNGIKREQLHFRTQIFSGSWNCSWTNVRFILWPGKVSFRSNENYWGSKSFYKNWLMLVLIHSWSTNGTWTSRAFLIWDRTLLSGDKGRRLSWWCAQNWWLRFSCYERVRFGKSLIMRCSRTRRDEVCAKKGSKFLTFFRYCTVLFVLARKLILTAYIIQLG